jgi:uncharacterized sulfatase
MNSLLRLVAVLCVIALPVLAQDKPNFVVVLGDDVGWDAFGCTGSTTARTPNVDTLATQSIQLDRFYCSVSQCAPIRAELYTGLYPNHNGVKANHSKSKRDVLNVADHLKPLGYRIGLTGKSHFGLGKERFDKIPGFPEGANGSIGEYDLSGVREYISKSDEPFCVFICSVHAHHPWDQGDESKFPVDKLKLPPHYIDTPSARLAIAKHAAEVEEYDRQLGDTVAMLKELKLEDNTVLIFLSEQGIAMPRGKWSPYDYGSRALCLARWPGKIKPRKSSAITMYCDIVPTLVDLAGGKTPGLDGKSLRDVWLGDADTHRDAAFISNVHPFWQKAVVTDQYKLIWTGHPEREHIWGNFNAKGKFFAKPWAEWLEAAKTDKDAARKVQHVLHPAPYELYRIDKDPYEVNNLAENPEYATKVQTLKTQLLALMKSADEPLEPPPPKAPKQKKKKERKK